MSNAKKLEQCVFFPWAIEGETTLAIYLAFMLNCTQMLSN